MLISDSGEPLLTDFGLSRMLHNDGMMVSITTTMTRFAGSVPWMAPELLDPAKMDPDHKFHTMATDIWAFGMVIYMRCIAMDVNMRDSLRLLLT